ncbi:MAG: serine protease [Deltaproteobacteria bacterium]|nr:serine protease [Deltaproteobacteria bacterium]
MRERRLDPPAARLRSYALALVTCLATGSAWAQGTTTPPDAGVGPETPAPEVLARLSAVERATVRVIAMNSVAAVRVGAETIAVPVVGHGSGVVIEPDGVILTARHVVENGLLVAVWKPGHPEPLAAVVAHQAEEDYALLVAPGEFPDSLTLPAAGAAPAAATRTRVFVFGYPEDLFEELPAATEGIISRQSVTGLYQISAAVNPGNSGGPLVDEHDTLLGVVILRRRDAEGMGYALPIETVASAYPAVRELGSVAEAQQRVASPDWAAQAELAALNARWAVADSGTGTGGWLHTIGEACGVAAGTGTAAAAARLEDLAPQDPTGVAALLLAAYQWNVAVCDAHQVGLGSSDLLAVQPVRAWIGGSHPTLHRIFTAVQALRKAQELNPNTVKDSSFAQALLEFESALAGQVRALGSPYPPISEGGPSAVAGTSDGTTAPVASAVAEPATGTTDLVFRTTDLGLTVSGVPVDPPVPAPGALGRPLFTGSDPLACQAPCTLRVPNDSYTFWVGGESFPVHAGGGRQDWEVEAGSGTAELWGSILTYSGLGAIGTGLLLMLPGFLMSDSEYSSPDIYYITGGAVMGLGGLALLIGIPVWASSSPSAVLRSTTPAGPTTPADPTPPAEPSRELALLPGIVGADPDTGRPAWGVHLALTL